MNKDAYYFPHFSNARHDRKVKRIIKELGVEGYGIYFMLLEVLREQTTLQYPMDDIDLLADEFRTSEQKVRTVICNYKLFDVTPDEMFFSPKLIEYLEPYFKMKAQRQLAGQKSAEARQRKALQETRDQQPSNDRSTTVQQSKVKESKVKKRIDSTWRNNFEIYKQELRDNLKDILADSKWMQQQEKYNPGVDIKMSIEKSVLNYWGKEAGWKKKKSARIDKPDWKATFANAVTMKSNIVYK